MVSRTFTTDFRFATTMGAHQTNLKFDQYIDNHDNDPVVSTAKIKTLVKQPEYFDCFSQKGFEGTYEEDRPLRLTKGDKEIAPT